MMKICVVTGSRADYGLLKNVMYTICDDESLELQIISTGMHQSPSYGLTFREIEKDGFTIDKKVEMLVSSDTATGITNSIGLGVIGMGEALGSLRPNLVLLLGDRFEILAASVAAMIARIPIVHLHGGETTIGAFDESIRHAITKMASLHFVAAEDYRRRVLQLGEDPDRVFNVGGLGIDSLNRLELYPKSKVEELLGIEFLQKALLVTFHPVTLDVVDIGKQVDELLSALDCIADTTLIFTFPNADTGSSGIVDPIKKFVARRNNSYIYQSLGQKLYFSCVSCCDGVIGNSSSGLLEVPSLKKGTVNIGDRQEGRLKASSVIDCEPEKSEILAAINRLYSSEFQAELENVQNPYGAGGAVNKIVETIKELGAEISVKKTFFDIPGKAE